MPNNLRRLPDANMKKPGRQRFIDPASQLSDAIFMLA
jgi:hypothetical protein